MVSGEGLKPGTASQQLLGHTVCHLLVSLPVAGVGQDGLESPVLPLPHHSSSGIVHLKPRGLDIPEVPCPHRDLYKELCLPLGAPAAAQVWLRSPRCPPGSSCEVRVAPWDGKGPLGSVSWGSPQTQLGLELCLVTACSTSASWGLTETCSAMGENSLLPVASHCWFLSSGSLLVSCRSAQL